MTRTTTNLLGIVITILAGTYFYVMYCSECGSTVKKEPAKEMTVPIAPEATSYPFAFGSGDYTYHANDNFNFNISSASIRMPLSQNVTNGVTGLRTFLDENDNKVINITGYYKGDEVNNSAFPNLGLARATTVKGHFTKNGISSARINAYGELRDEIIAKEDIYIGPVFYSLESESENSDDQLKALYEKNKANPLVLYFNTAEASINLSAAQRQKVAEISRCLDKIEGATCTIIGHTDNTGTAETNLQLGQNRADFTKSYLIKNGIVANKIVTTSKGQAQPLESNATEEGKAKNRRTVITLN
ncbi:MAG: OmpA family protein [Flavobacteriaceae bacterium]